MTINNAMVVPPAFGGGQSSNADSYGFQSKETWLPGARDVRPLLSCMAHAVGGSWRVTVVGDLKVQAIWGSLGTRSLVEMDAPLIATFPGKVDIFAMPRTDDGASALVTVAPAFSGEQRDFRRLVTTAQAIPPDFALYRALTASVVTVRGTPVNVPALATLPLVSGSVLTSGTGYLEFTP